MMCVKETLPPRARLRWLLMTTRLSMSSFAGTARTLVAVGTSSDDSMLTTTRAAGPFKMFVVVAAAVPGARAALVALPRGTWTGAATAGADGAAAAAGGPAGAGTPGAETGAGTDGAGVSDVTVTSVLSTFAAGERAWAAADASVG